MLGSLRLLSISLILAIVFAGCSGTAIRNIDNSNIVKINSISKVEYAIKKGSTSKGWSVKKEKDGLFTVRQYIKGKYLVVLSVPYNANGYSINYKESTNLKYNSAENTIHKSYNKWVANLERNINSYLNKVSVMNDKDMNNLKLKDNARVTYIPRANGQFARANVIQEETVNLTGKTVYINTKAPFDNIDIKDSIKTECKIDTQVMDFIKEYSAGAGVNVQYSDNIKSDDLHLKISITNAISRGSAFIGHYKMVEIYGELVQGNKVLSNFRASRKDGGGAFGGYKGSCSVLGRATKVLGRDVSKWLTNPVNNAVLGHGVRYR